MVGCIAWGYLEMFFIMDPDQHKDANMECTVISRALELVHQHIKTLNPNAAMPRSLIIAADNTAREAKNQYFMSYCSWLKVC